MHSATVFTLILIVVIQVSCIEKRCHSSDPDESQLSNGDDCADILECQLFDESRASLELVCILQNDASLSNCSYEIPTARVTNFKSTNCPLSSVSKAISALPNSISVDISQSAIESLAPLSWSHPQLLQINVSHNEIRTIPDRFLFGAIETIEIDFSFNQLHSIHSSHFECAAKLQTIHLSNNQISLLTDDAFKNLLHLEYVDLTSNHIHWLDMFRNNRELHTLLVIENPIFNFDCNHFLKMYSITVRISWENVRYLQTNCEGTQFNVFLNDQRYGAVLPAQREIHCSEQSFQSIQQFDAGRNKFENIAKMLQCFGAALREMNVAGNFVGKLNTTTFNRFRNLEWLSLSDTNLLQFDFNQLAAQTKLEKLDISLNNLRDVRGTEFVGNFRHLTQFIAADNQLQRTLDIVKDLSQTIQYLDLSGNFVGPVNAQIFRRFVDLHTLKLNSTQLSFATENPFGALLNLKVLDISLNNMRGVNLVMLSKTLNRLTEFSAADCHIDNATNIIQYFGSTLSHLDLSGNSVGQLKSNAFEKLVNLKSLLLSNTNLIHFDSTMLKNQEHLRFFNISYNKLRSFDVGALSTSLVKLAIEGNDLIELSNFDRKRFALLESLAISENRLPCEYLAEMRHNWDGLKLIGDPMQQQHGNCNRNIQNSKRNTEFNHNNFRLFDKLPSILVYLMLIFGPIGIVVLIGCICFAVRRRYFDGGLRRIVFDERCEGKNGSEEFVSDHIYEEIESFCPYDRLRFDTDPIPLNNIAGEYHNVTMIKSNASDT